MRNLSFTTLRSVKNRTAITGVPAVAVFIAVTFFTAEAKSKVPDWGIKSTLA